MWPAISVVSMPVYANVTKYQDFMTLAETKYHSIEDLNAMENETFYTDPKDFILALNMDEYYPDMIKNLTRIPVEPPFVRTVLNDYVYNGYVAVVSLEAIKKYLITEKEVSPNDKDFTFELMIFLNVSTESEKDLEILITNI